MGYLVSRSHNFLADQDVARAIAAVEPNMRAGARANRAFLGRAVRFLAAAGIRQFLDIGSDIPTERNVHEVARQAAADARVVYADIDEVAVAHSKAILAGNQDATVIEADLREPEKILARETTRRLIDFAQPAGLLLMAVLHFIADAGDPWRIVATLRDALAPGSYLVLGTAPARAGPWWRAPPRRCTTAASPPRSMSNVPTHSGHAGCRPNLSDPGSMLIVVNRKPPREHGGVRAPGRAGDTVGGIP